jgi:hypothetical protein
MFHFVRKSRNIKIGPIPATTSTAATCPGSCPFNHLNEGGCYAAGGPLALHWRRVTDGAAGGTFAELLAAVRSIPAGQLWRHNQAGDLAGVRDTLDVAALDALTAANSGRRGFTYTHKPLRDAAERAAVARANAAGFTVNLSANDAADADRLADLEIGPVVVVMPRDAAENAETPAGRKIVICPATQRDDVSCATCKLCARADRAVVVGFPAHGVQARRADAVARGGARIVAE